jgi:hypothetical protein
MRNKELSRSRKTRPAIWVPVQRPHCIEGSANATGSAPQYGFPGLRSAARALGCPVLERPTAGLREEHSRVETQISALLASYGFVAGPSTRLTIPPLQHLYPL